MNNFISVNSYWIINSAIALSFVVTSIIYRLPIIKTALMQSQRLNFARVTFLLMMIMMIFAPTLISRLPIPQHSDIVWQPIMAHVKATFNFQAVTASTNVFTPTSHFELPSLSTMLIVILTMGLVLNAYRYLRNLLQLNRIIRQSIYKRSFGKIKLIYTENTHIPFCWVGL